MLVDWTLFPVRRNSVAQSGLFIIGQQVSKVAGFQHYAYSWKLRDLYLSPTLLPWIHLLSGFMSGTVVIGFHKFYCTYANDLPTLPSPFATKKIKVLKE